MPIAKVTGQGFLLQSGNTGVGKYCWRHEQVTQCGIMTRIIGEGLLKLKLYPHPKRDCNGKETFRVERGWHVRNLFPEQT